MGCSAFWQQISSLDKALRDLRIHGLGIGSGPYEQLWKIRGQVFARIGYKIPREVQLILRLVALSPGEIQLYFDVENGWMTHARHGPGVPWVSRSITASTAITLLQDGLTHSLEDELMAPDPYVGE